MTTFLDTCIVLGFGFFIGMILCVTFSIREKLIAFIGYAIERFSYRYDTFKDHFWYVLYYSFALCASITGLLFAAIIGKRIKNKWFVQDATRICAYFRLDWDQIPSDVWKCIFDGVEHRKYPETIGYFKR